MTFLERSCKLTSKTCIRCHYYFHPSSLLLVRQSFTMCCCIGLYIFFSYRTLNYLLICALGSVQTTQNFVTVIVFFFFLKSVNRKPFLERTIFSTYQNFFKSNQTSGKFGGLQSFVRRQNPLLLDSSPTSGHLIPRT